MAIKRKKRKTFKLSRTKIAAGLKASGFYMDRDGDWIGPDGSYHRNLSSARRHMIKIYK